MHSDVPTFLATAYPTGAVVFDFPAQKNAWVKRLAGDVSMPVEVTIVEAGQQKTRRQEKGFHAMVKPWADKRGDSVDELKQWLLAEIFGTHTFTVPGTDAAIQVLAEPHTSKLTRRQYCDLIEGAMRLAAERDNYYLIAPDEYRKAKEAATKQAERAAKKAAAAERVKCERCGSLVPRASIVVREREYSDGGQQGTEEIEVCKACAKQIDQEAA